MDGGRIFLHDERSNGQPPQRAEPEWNGHQGVEKKKMPYVDLDIARQHCQEIRELVTRHPGGTRDERALQKVQQACRAATSAVSDRECREHAGAVEDYACEVFAGAAEFRPEMLQELSAILARLAALEALRDAVAQHRAA
jgi:hypothetical protein